MLRDILLLVASEVGLNIDDPSNRALLISRVGLAAKRLFESADLDGSNDQKIFDLSVDSHLVTLPAYVGHIRGIRKAINREKVDLLNPSMRYHQSGDNDVWPLQYNNHGKTALERDISNASILKFSIPIVESTDITITIVGATNTASRIAETITLIAGSTEINSTKNFKSVEKIYKSRNTENDVVIKDVNNTRLGIIPNNIRESSYRVIQVYDALVTPEISNDLYAVEIRYKKALGRLENDFDSFTCGDQYDEAIFWEYMRFEGAADKDADESGAANAMKQSILDNIAIDETKGTKKKMDIARNKWRTAMQLNKTFGFNRNTFR